MPMSLKERFLNVPNYITLGRIGAVFVLMILLLFAESGGRTISYLAAGLFLVAMFSDMVDGYYARKQKITSTFGKFFDPLADKLLFLVAMVMLIPLGRIAAWIVVLLLVREIIVTSIRSVAVDEGIVIAASHWGKYKSAFLSCATTAFLIHYPFWGVDWRMIGWVLIWPGLFLSIGSGIHYTWGFITALKCKEHTP